MSSNCDKSFQTINNCRPFFDGYNSELILCDQCYESGQLNPSSYVPGAPCYRLIESVYEKNDSVLYGKIKSYIQDLFDQLYSRNCQISASQDSQFYHPVQEELYNVCYQFNNLCSFALGGNIEGSFSVCKNNKYLQNQYTKDDLSTNKNLAYFCGCYLQSSNYIPTVPLECDSLCGAEQSIKLFDISNNQIRCQNNICAISDITINIYESTVGNINFEQICGGICGEIACSKCYLENITIDILQSKVGDINLVQKCGGVGSTQETAFECYEIDNNGKYVQIPCEEEPSSSVSINIIIFIVVIVFIVILVILLIIFLIFKNRSVKVSKDDVTIQKNIVVERPESKEKSKENKTNLT